MFHKKPYKYEEGGFVDDNTEMLISKINEMSHHLAEIKSIVNKKTKVEAWVLARAQRSANDLSDITHYLEGRKKLMQMDDSGTDVLVIKETIELPEFIDSEEQPMYKSGGRIDEMVEHWEKYGWAGSILGNDDTDFFERIGMSPMDVATTSFTGADIKYYNDKILDIATGGFRKKYADGGMFDSEQERELKELVKEDYPTFVKLLGDNIKDPKFREVVKELGRSKSVKYKVINVKCEDLKPTQNEISLDKSLAFPLTSAYYAELYLKAENPIRIKNNTILTCDNGNYIIDGHHRWSQVFVLNPKAEMACTDFYELKSPIAGLKATQLGISADLGYLPTQNVQDINMLTVTEKTLKDYVSEKITDEVRDVFSKHGIDNPEEHIWNNVLLLKTKNKPIKNASSRDFMPQTDLADNFTEYTPNISKLATGGGVDDAGKISHEQVYFGGDTDSKNKWKVKFKYDVENEEYRTVTVDATSEEEARGKAEKKFGKVYDDFEITDVQQCYECGGETRYAGGGMVQNYRESLENMSDEELAEEWEYETGVSAEDALSDMEDERETYIDELIRLFEQNMRSRGEKYADGGMMAKGGGIQNQYDGMSTSQLWDSWSKEQRVHFIQDHGIKSIHHSKVMEYSFYDLPADVKQSIDYHRIEGQYADGGVINYLMIPKSMIEEITESVRAGYDQVVEGRISPKRKGVALINKDYEVRGTYDLGLKDAIKDLVSKVKDSKYAKGGGISRSQKQYNNEVDQYKWFVVDLENKRAVSGWEYRGDGMDALKDYDGDKNFKLVAESKLASMGIENPKERWKKYQDGGMMDKGNIQGLNPYEFAYLYVKKAISQQYRERYLSPIGLWKTQKAKEVEASLISKGFLNSTGAITSSGKQKAKDIDDATGKSFSSGYIGAMSSDRAKKFDIVLGHFGEKYKMGGKTSSYRATFNDKVMAISKKLSGTKVPAKLKKDYGKKYSPKEAVEAAKRIAGAMRKKEKLS